MQRERSAERQSTRSLGASYAAYADAQRAVDYLSDQRFPVERVAIVAEGLRIIEQVTGRVGYGQALVGGALSGALTGALFGFIFGLFNWITPLISALNLALYGFILGAIVGAVIGLVAYAISAGRRDFSSVSSISAPGPAPWGTAARCSNNRRTSPSGRTVLNVTTWITP